MKIFLQSLVLIFSFYPVTIFCQCIKGNCENGKGVHVSPVTTYVGEFRNGQFYGHGVLSTFDGHKLVGQVEGQWKNGIPQGEVIVTDPDGSKDVVVWMDGIPRTPKRTEDKDQQENTEYKEINITYPDGKRYVGSIKDGVPNGKGTMFLLDDEKYTGHFRNGEFVGR